MSNLMPTYKPAPVEFVSGEGCRLFDTNGKSYLDFLSGIAVTSLGHSHPSIRDAVSAQVAKLLHVSNLFETGMNEEVAGMIDVLIGDGTPVGGKVFFTNSGAESNECAIKLARRYGGPGRHVVVSAYGSFHGRTLATLHATGQPSKHEPFAPLPEGFRHVAYGDLKALEQALDASLVTAVLLECIEGEGGIITPPPGYLRAVRALCDERNILMMLDEVQTGLGRTGRWFAFQHEDFMPDVVTLAKALGNGMPVGACWAKASVAESFNVGDHGTTFGGQPLAMSAVRATLATMAEIDAPYLARTQGAYLRELATKIPGVSHVRGEGLLLGVVLHEGIDATAIVAAALDLGLVLNAPAPGVVRLVPPLIVSRAECDEAMTIFAAAIKEVMEKIDE
jgi:predicted acetylornithine/succinylornithine family transaminase